MDNIRIIYVKELNSIDEIFKENSKLTIFFKQCIWFFKRVFCIVTIAKENVCILPYRELKSFSKIKIYLIKKILKKINLPVVLSNYLDTIEELKQGIFELSLPIIDGMNFSAYLLPEIIQYICKMTKEKKEQQEISILIQKQTTDKMKLILDLAKTVKRIQIVTTKISGFQRLENELEDKFGITCQITSNKRKSLLKSKIIINLDTSEELFNQFAINPKAIIIDINNKVDIHSKSFCGIHIYDYQIKTNTIVNMKKTFETKKIYEAQMIGSSYEQIRKKIKEDNIVVTNLIGKNGVIHYSEYERTSKK